MIHQLTAKNLNKWSGPQCQVSLRRINKFINSEELDPHAVDHDRNVEAAVLAKSQYLKPPQKFCDFSFQNLVNYVVENFLKWIKQLKSDKKDWKGSKVANLEPQVVQIDRFQCI